MKKHAVSLVLVLGCAMFVAGGCAKQQVVKKDEPAVPAATAPAKPSVKTEIVKEQPVKQAQIKESAVQDKLEPVPRAGDLKAALERIYFDFDAYVLSQEARATLVKNAELIKKDPAVKVRIEGNCDERGSDEYNLALGERRARSAMQYLITMGIPAERLSVISYGKEKPAEPGHNETAWTKNRRDEFAVQ
jgi:peptidoglycan-associated lipoprotein